MGDEVCLCCVAGFHRGRAWRVGPAGLTIGRSSACDVHLDEPAVSRRHCRISHDGARIILQLEKCGKPVLVNGFERTDTVLHPGDELGVGDSRFAIVATDGETASCPDCSDGFGTLTWTEDGHPVLVADHSSESPPALLPTNANELARLYRMGRAFASAGTMDGVFAVLEHELEERYRPRAMYVFRQAPGGTPHVAFQSLASQDLAPEPPYAVAQMCLVSGDAYVRPEMLHTPDGPRLLAVFASPATMGDEHVAALAVCLDAPQGVYAQSDVHFLRLVGFAIAPIIHAMDRLNGLRRENERLRALRPAAPLLLGESQAMQRVRDQIRDAAATDLTVIVTGETGTGKELAARMIHSMSVRNSKPFVVIHCPAIPRELFESELFGYEKGAFTGAHRGSVGLLATADGGTVFLDEIADLSLDNQARFLRVLDEGTFRRVGSLKESRVNLRIIAATNRDLQSMVRDGRFREDLYHRLAEFCIELPPLRERRSDIPILAQHFFQLEMIDSPRELHGIVPLALDELRARDWPGNVRELRNCIRRAMAVSASAFLTPDDVRQRGTMHPASLQQAPFTLEEVERRHVEAIFHQCNGDISRTAKALGIGRSTLYRKLAEYGVLPGRR